MRALRAHWQQLYRDRKNVQLSWYEERPQCSLELIAQANLPPAAAILDAGGGASSLASELVRLGYRDVTVCDISGEALERARDVRGDDRAISFVVADLRGHDFGRRFDLWHDRAVFHFMVAVPDRDAYLATLSRGLRPGGHLILATFGPDGPTTCSGLPVNRYDGKELSVVLGPEFQLVTSRIQDHTTPSGTRQQFLWTHWRRARPDAP